MLTIYFLSDSTLTQESNTSTTRGCYLGKQFHSMGSKWHPFLVPNGFDRCTECVCDPITLEVKCTRTVCILDCDERIAIKPDDKSCCKVVSQLLHQPHFELFNLRFF